MTTIATRVSPGKALAHARTLGWRGLVPMRNNPATLIGYIFQPLVFIFLFVYIFGGSASGGDRDAVVMYAVPGALIQAALWATISTGINLHADLDNGFFDRLRSLPIARSAPLTGRILTDSAAMILSLVLAFAVGLLVGFRIHTGPLQVVLALLILTVFWAALSCGAALIGLTVKSATSIQMLAAIVLFPLVLASGAFASPDTMPGWLQGWMNVNPVTHLSAAVRGLLVGEPYTEDLGLHIGVTLGSAVALTLLFAPLAIRAYRRKI